VLQPAVKMTTVAARENKFFWERKFIAENQPPNFLAGFNSLGNQ